MQSYATSEYADEYLDGLMNTDAWSGAQASDKERALLSATVHIDALSSLGGGFRGCKATDGQLQEFPRSPDTVVPEAVKRACCHEALAILEQSRDKTAQGREQAIRQGVASVSIGGVSESYVKLSDQQSGLRGRLLSDMAMALIRPYLAVQGVFPIV